MSLSAGPWKNGSALSKSSSIFERSCAKRRSGSVTRFGEMLRTLAEAGVDFILVGGLAAAAHGSPRSTQDVDVVYSRGGQPGKDGRRARATPSIFTRRAPPAAPP